MFYLGFSNCASAELCLLVFFSFFFYFFLAKREDFWKFTKVRPDFDCTAVIGEQTRIDGIFHIESFYSLYVDRIENSELYFYWLFEYESEEEIIANIQSRINEDVTRIKLRRFMDREVTERWMWLYKGYDNPKDAWYS